MKSITLLFCSVSLLAAPLVSVATENKEPPQQQTKPQSRTISKEVATQLAQQRYPGRVLKVQSEQKQFKVRLMQSDGRVVNVLVDGQNGRVKREE